MTCAEARGAILSEIHHDVPILLVPPDPTCPPYDVTSLASTDNLRKLHLAPSVISRQQEDILSTLFWSMIA